jgi:hypothetical protein
MIPFRYSCAPMHLREPMTHYARFFVVLAVLTVNGGALIPPIVPGPVLQI